MKEKALFLLILVSFHPSQMFNHFSYAALFLFSLIEKTGHTQLRTPKNSRFLPPWGFKIKTFLYGQVMVALRLDSYTGTHSPPSSPLPFNIFCSAVTAFM